MHYFGDIRDVGDWELTMYEIKPYEKEHLLALKVDPGMWDLINFIGFDTLANSINSKGPVYSGFADDKLVVIGGINIMWPGVGEAWAMLAASYREHGFWLHRNVVKILKTVENDLKLERLQAVVLKGHWAGIEWVDRLGFQYEGEMPKYFKGRDYLRYAKIFNNGVNS